MAEISHLVKMHVKNIWCIWNDGLTIELDDIVCLVGPNNVGKSTVLRAYELAADGGELKKDEVNQSAAGKSPSVELWVHIPKSAWNIDDKWKEADGDLLLVRSKWEWPAEGWKPTRFTWNPSQHEYAEDWNASWLDTVFSSRLPRPFRIGSLDNPSDEHKKLLQLVLDPVVQELKKLMNDGKSELNKKIAALILEAEKPVDSFKAELENIEKQVNSSYNQVFNSSSIHLSVSLGDIGFDPLKSLSSGSRVEIWGTEGKTGWEQQWTGSQRALFWSMLQVRSELSRLSEKRKGIDKLKADLIKAEAKAIKKTADEKKISDLKEKIETLENDDGEWDEFFLPGYMLLIDEPETALHPSAVRAAKDHLYALAWENGWQVMLSTHHPAFIDPLKDHTSIVRLHRSESHLPPNTYRSEKMEFDGNDRENLKALMLFDSNVAEMFFGNEIIIVEWDTEYAAFHETMELNPTEYPPEKRPLIIRARWKATIAILIKILSHFKMDFSILHDIDSPKRADGHANSAYTTNRRISEAIEAARKEWRKVIYQCSCPNFEQHHGLSLPAKDKPYASWRAVKDNDSVRASVSDVLSVLAKKKDSENDGVEFENLLKTWVTDNDNTELLYQF